MPAHQKYPCPVCKANTLYDFNTSEGVTLDFCDKCRGVWFDRGEVANYVDLASDIPNLAEDLKSAAESPYACPKCSVGMQRMKYTPEGNLIIDRCPQCEGIFLDGGELRALEDIAARLESPKSRMARALKEMHDAGFTVFR